MPERTPSSDRCTRRSPTDSLKIPRICGESEQYRLYDSESHQEGNYELQPRTEYKGEKRAECHAERPGIIGTVMQHLSDKGTGEGTEHQSPGHEEQSGHGAYGRPPVSPAASRPAGRLSMPEAGNPPALPPPSAPPTGQGIRPKTAHNRSNAPTAGRGKPPAAPAVRAGNIPRHP